MIWEGMVWNGAHGVEWGHAVWNGDMQCGMGTCSVEWGHVVWDGDILVWNGDVWNGMGSFGVEWGHVVWNDSGKVAYDFSVQSCCDLRTYCTTPSALDPVHIYVHVRVHVCCVDRMERTNLDSDNIYSSLRAHGGGRESAQS